MLYRVWVNPGATSGQAEWQSLLQFALRPVRFLDVLIRYPLAAAVVKIDAAMKAKKRAEASNEAVSAWAREALSFLDKYQNDDGNIDDALAALKAAL